MSTDRLTRLALAAGTGDAAAVAAFVTATQAEVWLFCAHLAGHRHADDLTQETYLRAFTALPRFAARSTVRTWLLSIARRAAADHFRAEARRLAATDDDWRTAAERNQPRVPGVADTVVLRELIRGLEPDRRAAFVLTQILGLAYAEAAAVCGCPVGTVRSRVARAREDLVRAATADAGLLRAGRCKDVHARGAC
jgi:RNA polymerase sigma-70 factor (ECF subfamily)